MNAIILLDSRSRSFLIPLHAGKIRVEGMGVIDTDSIDDNAAGRVVTISGRRFLALKPTISLAMEHIERGPQTISGKDAALIIFYLGIGPGSTVLEAGAGSGSLTLALLHAVGEAGMVFSMDNRHEHLRKARKNVMMTPYSGCWAPVLGDIRRAPVRGNFDACILDIPDPWNALEACSKALCMGSRLASFSPTVNQTERMVEASAAHGLVHYRTFEVIMRNLSVVPGAVRPSFEAPGHTGYISIFTKCERL